MNIGKYEEKLSTITLILLLTISATIAILPAANAQTAQPKATVAYLGLMPDPVGVNQEVLLHIGITDYRTSAEDGFEGLTVVVTNPNGDEEILGPFKTDSTGGTGSVFIPTMVGTYTFQTIFPEQTWELASMWGPSQVITYLASESEIVTLNVQEDPIDYYPMSKLPSEYWSRPIDSQLREWNTISASWVSEPNNLYAPYNEAAADTPHILWTKELTTGGLAGGELGGYSYGIGDAYEGKFPTRFIIDGRLYYEVGGSRSETKHETVCVDLHTGEEIWRKVFMDNRSISFAQVFYWDGMNYHGAFPYLYVSANGNYYAFEAYTGDWRFTVENIPSGTTIYDEDNHIYILNVDTANGWMALWDMTAVCLSKATGYGGGSWGNTVHEQTFDANEAPEAWIWNVSIPEGLPGSVQIAGYGDRVVGAASSVDEVTVWGLSLEDGDEGDLLFNETWDAPAYWSEMNLTVSGYFGGGWVAWSLEDGVGILHSKETREHFAFSTETGEYLWGSTFREHYLNALMDFVSRDIRVAYGKVFSASVSGIVYCYDALTGDLEWTYEASDPYSEMLWSNNWWLKIQFITDGKIYMTHIEHSPIDPRPRGAPYICLDVETGEEVFRIDGALRGTHWGGAGIIGDSIIVTMNTYDQRIYAIGKGASETTATINQDVITLGSSAQITGTVMDVSPGTQSTALAIRFPGGVPAISDEDMGEWMKYVYMQFERPADATGVTVVFCAIDPNGDYMDIDRTTTDSYGNYALAFKPEMEGTYQIIANFEGSGGYYGSTATTYLTVDPAPAVSTPIDTDEPVDTTEPTTEAPFITTEVAIIAAVAVAAVIGVAAYWALKRK
ncbi:MAG: hypothetical protein CW691_00200 [Candidatus Bathyarchaeum sp.]|nr:MAG: hypothetical protein CW691_00200 [Candidatus Bathyarchaeum sp.]